jgi:hypothetical protein
MSLAPRSKAQHQQFENTTELRAQPELKPQVFSMARWNQRHFNERLLDLFIDNLALDPLWVKNHPGYEDLRTYGAIAA